MPEARMHPGTLNIKHETLTGSRKPELGEAMDGINYFRMGWEHIMSWDALDHLLFITALAIIYTLSDWKQLLILVTAFTIGHSLTLYLSARQVFSFEDKWVEFLIPVTIVITSVSNLFQKQFTKRSIRINYILALLFGLIHGMGFANTIRMMLPRNDHDIVWPLLQFNLGLEAGQIIVVLIILSATYIALNGVHRIIPAFTIIRREWVIFISGGIFALSLMMALERIPKSRRSEDGSQMMGYQTNKTLTACGNNHRSSVFGLRTIEIERHSNL